MKQNSESAIQTWRATFGSASGEARVVDIKAKTAREALTVATTEYEREFKSASHVKMEIAS